MKCQFCNQRCSLITPDQKQYSKSEMSWLCNKHPTQVIHHVSLSRQVVRNKPEIRGTNRNWDSTSISWTDNNKSMRAIFYKGVYEPNDFVIYDLTNSKSPWDWKEIIFLDAWPPNITPENIISKVKTLITFS